MQWIALVVTVLILAALGNLILNLHDAGQYWIWILAPVLIAIGIYRLGEDEDRAYFHRGWARLTGRPVRPEIPEERHVREE
jgi:hypothetical protein